MFWRVIVARADGTRIPPRYVKADSSGEAALEIRKDMKPTSKIVRITEISQQKFVQNTHSQY